MNDVENSNCIRDLKLSYLLDQSLLTVKQREDVKLVPDACDIETFKTLRDIQFNMNDFVSNGRNLLIFSKITGNGKTEWAKKLLLSFFNDIWHTTDFECRGLFINIPKFINSLRENIEEKNTYLQHIKKNIMNADIVVWDELGANIVKDRDYIHGYLLSYINSRIENGKANIYTSNLDTNELFDSLGDRVYSRIVNNSKVLELKGCDKRGLNKW